MLTMKKDKLISGLYYSYYYQKYFLLFLFYVWNSIDQYAVCISSVSFFTVGFQHIRTYPLESSCVLADLPSHLLVSDDRVGRRYVRQQEEKCEEASEKPSLVLHCKFILNFDISLRLLYHHNDRIQTAVISWL